MFASQRRPGSINSKILPTWLLNPAPEVLRNFESASKNDVLVRRVELLEANPNYAVIKDSRGAMRTVSTKDLAPVPERVAERVLNTNENHKVNK